MNFVDYTTVVRDLLIDFSSLYFLSYVILYRKYRNVEMFVSSALFNIFILLIVMSIVRTDFNIAFFWFDAEHIFTVKESTSLVIQ